MKLGFIFIAGLRTQQPMALTVRSHAIPRTQHDSRFTHIMDTGHVCQHYQTHSDGVCLTTGLQQLCQPRRSLQRLSFNMSGQAPAFASFSTSVKAPTLTKYQRRKCAHLDCTTVPSFNLEGEKKGVSCLLHKEEVMINVMSVSLSCEREECRLRRSYNFDGESRGRFCAAHKHDGMIDVASKVCEYEGCTTRAGFNTPGAPGARLCSIHKHPTMVSVFKKACEFVGCRVTASFGAEGLRQRRFCATHKLQGMVQKAVVMKNKS